MSAFTRSTFGELAPLLWDYGYQPVPIKLGFKAPLIDDWQAGHPPGHYLPKYRSWGTGCLAANCPALDLDIKDRELVRELIDLAGELLGYAPFRVGAPPKVLLPYSTGGAFDKISGRWWALPGEDFRSPGYSPHRVEILATGQQFVAYARHPRGRFYRWRKGCPMEIPRIDLPEIDAAMAAGFVATAEAMIEAVGGCPLRRQEKLWTPDTGHPDQRAHHKTGGPRIDSTWQQLDPETLAKRVDARHARRLKGGGWITACPAHHSEGQRSLSVTPRDGGGSLVHCFADCDFREVARAISSIVGA